MRPRRRRAGRGRAAGGHAARRGARRGRPAGGRARRGSARGWHRGRRPLRRGAVGRPTGERAGSRPAILGENTWASPSARKRAKPGSGRRGSRPGGRLGDARAPPRGGGAGDRRGRARVVRPGHAAAIGKQRATTSASRSTTSTSAPPMYDATALMPIRASVLRRPASKAATRLADGVGSRVSVLGAARAGQLGGQLDGQPRVDGGRADGEDHRHGVDVEDVDGARPRYRSGRGGPPRSGRCGRRRRRGSTAPAAGRATQPRRSGRGPRSRARAAATASAASRSSAVGEAVGSRGRIPGRIERPDPRPGRRPQRPPQQAVEVDDDRALRGERSAGRAAGRRAAPAGGPSSTRRSMTTRSRSGSIAGFVTWANAWRRWSATGRSRRPRPGGRRVVAHAPQRLVRLERHRLDVEPGPLGIEAGEVAQRCRSRGRDAGRRGRRRAGSVVVDRPRRVVDRQRGAGPRPSPRRPRGSPAGPARPGAARPGPAARAGPSRRPLNGMAPASDATATSRSRVTAKAAGRSPLRSTSAPTRRPSAKTIAAGPSHGARKPAVRRRSVATCGCGARRSASASGIAVSSAGVEVPAGRRQELERLVERQRVGAVRRQERAGGQQVAARSRSRPRPRSGRGPARDCRGPC